MARLPHAAWGLGDFDVEEAMSGSYSVAAGAEPGPDSVILHMSIVHTEKAELCDQLEAIADSLPYRVEPQACLKVAGRLVPLLRQAHRYEEELLFPLFEASRPADIPHKTILRLENEHRHDECLAEEITDELLRIGHGGSVKNPEAFGFMLRAFFDTVRRHLAFEREHMLLPAGA